MRIFLFLVPFDSLDFFYWFVSLVEFSWWYGCDPGAEGIKNTSSCNSCVVNHEILTRNATQYRPKCLKVNVINKAYVHTWMSYLWICWANNGKQLKMRIGNWIDHLRSIKYANTWAQNTEQNQFQSCISRLQKNKPHSLTICTANWTHRSMIDANIIFHLMSLDILYIFFPAQCTHTLSLSFDLVSVLISFLSMALVSCHCFFFVWLCRSSMCHSCHIFLAHIHMPPIIDEKITLKSVIFCQ